MPVLGQSMLIQYIHALISVNKPIVTIRPIIARYFTPLNISVLNYSWISSFSYYNWMKIEQRTSATDCSVLDIFILCTLLRAWGSATLYHNCCNLRQHSIIDKKSKKMQLKFVKCVAIYNCKMHVAYCIKLLEMHFACTTNKMHHLLKLTLFLSHFM